MISSASETTISAEAFLVQDFHQVGIRCGFDGKKFFKTLRSRQSFFKGAGVFPNGFSS